MIDCRSCSARLDDFLDGGLATAERDEVAAHLAACPDCRAEAEALRSILSEARALPPSLLPERELWPGIASRLPAVRQNRSVPAMVPTRSLPGWGRLAAAIALILFGAALGTMWARHTAAPQFAAEQARYTAESGELARQLAANPGAIAPATRAAVERSLGIIDRAIGEAEAALASDPGNTPLEQMLVSRYEQRLALLRHALGAGRMES
jgi:anti-sigma factor RsiW